MNSSLVSRLARPFATESRALRYPVETLLDLLSSGMTIEEITAESEDLEREDLLAAMAYAARLARTRRVATI